MIQTARHRLVALCFFFIAALFAHSDTLREGQVTVEFDTKQRPLAEQTLAVATKALREYEPHLSAGSAPIRIVICATQGAFFQYAGAYAQPDVTGIAIPEQGIIALRDPSLRDEPTDYRGTVRHELVHILIARNTNQDNVPQWLNEGAAMVLSGEHRWDSVTRVGYMALEGHIIEYTDLQFAFLQPGKEMQFGDAYAQSLSMTQYLRDRLGDDGFWAFLKSLRTQPFGDALQNQLHLYPHEFWQAWVGSLWRLVLVISIVSGFSVFQLMAILTVIAYLRKRRRGRQIVRKWETEDPDDADFVELDEFEEQDE